MNEETARYWRATAPEHKPRPQDVGHYYPQRYITGIDTPIPYQPTTKVAARVPSDQLIKVDIPFKWDRAAYDRMRTLLFDAFTRAARPKVRNGDKITVSTTGYAQNVKADGTFEVAKTRTPFGEGEIVAAFTRPPTVSTWRIDEHAPAKPKVGDVITGAELAAHAWKRGTVIETIEHGERATTYVLTADGEWLALVGANGAETCGRTYTFDLFSKATVRIVYVGR